MNFGEKSTEMGLPVWQSPKYKETKTFAEDVIKSKKYELAEGDFWILMNSTKNKDKMIYSGLIISHNGCLKINDKLEDKFKPDCVSVVTDGFAKSLVYTYSCAEQGIYEVGEVNEKNCKNAYPYAMAFKRCFDRVVLKLSKLAYHNIYSDSESDEFTQQMEVTEEKFMDRDKLSRILAYVEKYKTNTTKVCAKFGIKDLSDMTKEQYTKCCESFESVGKNAKS